MKNDIELFNTLQLLKFDSVFYRSLCLALLKANQSIPSHAFVGDAVGYASFMFSSLCRDMSITAYEGIRSLHLENVIDGEAYNGFWYDLKMFRRNMHLYNPRSSYKRKADTIIANQSALYKMDINDTLFSLRSDVSLAFDVENKKSLLGGDYYIQHLTDGHKNTWTGEHYRDFLQHVSSTINTLSAVELQGSDYTDNGVFTSDAVQIELFDYKSQDLFTSSPITTNSVIFRVLILLSQASFASIVISHNIDNNVLRIHPECLVFLVKWLSMYYDEAIDSVENMAENCDDIDKHHIKKAFASVLNNNRNTREKARDLRNLCHYSFDIQGNSPSNSVLISGNIIKDILGVARIETWGELSDLYMRLNQAIFDIADAARRLLPIVL